MRSGRKVYDAPRYQTIAVEYDREVALHNASSSSAYQRVAASIWQNIDFGMFNQFNWSINGGLFWDKSDMQFPDYQHFCTPGLPVTEYTFDNSFALLSNYAYSTNSHWVQAHVSWYTPYLLFKQIPFLKRMIFDEALHLRMLKVGSYRPYSEVGYSIGVTDVARVGVFVGFESWQYKQVGVSVSIPLIRNFKQFVR